MNPLRLDAVTALIERREFVEPEPLRGFQVFGRVVAWPLRGSQRVEHFGLECLRAATGSIVLLATRRLSSAHPTVDLFVRCYNARQLKKRKYPKYPAPLTAMI